MKYTCRAVSALIALFGCSLAIPAMAQSDSMKPRHGRAMKSPFPPDSGLYDDSVDPALRPAFLTPFATTQGGSMRMTMPMMHHKPMFMTPPDPGLYDTSVDPALNPEFLTPFNLGEYRSNKYIWFSHENIYDTYEDPALAPEFLTPFTITAYDYDSPFTAFYANLAKANDTLDKLTAFLTPIVNRTTGAPSAPGS